MHSESNRVHVAIRVRPALKREVNEDGTLSCSLAVNSSRRMVSVSRDGSPIVISPSSDVLPDNVLRFDADGVALSLCI